MIDKRELLDFAAKHQLNPHVVEKDYALGWMLAGISAHSTLGESWVFKGGTCLKKCFFETYRFSEDLDFTLQDAAHLDEAFLKAAFAEISAWIYDACGLQFPAEMQDFEFLTNPRGNTTCQGKVSYRGPLASTSGGLRGLPRIKLDLTADERIVLPPARATIFHPYSDAPADGISVLAYTYEETFGEKVRALAERTRPRDLYDVINLFRNEEARPAPAVLRDVLQQKCDFKGIGFPELVALEQHKTDLEGTWENMLGHQLPALPAVDAFWNDLPAFFDWLISDQMPETPLAYKLAQGESVIRERVLQLPYAARAATSSLEIIRFAGANHLCVDLDYIDLDGNRSTRRIEPYSLRRTQDGNILLHAYNVDKNSHRSYRVERIKGAQISNQSFTPRYAVELTPTGVLSVSPPSIGARSQIASRPRSSFSRSSSRIGPVYVYECPYCGKKFERNKMNATLNPHKDKQGYNCSGRHGIFVDTKYR